MRKIFLLILCVLLTVFPACKKVKKPNILLITIDTLRRDHLGFYGYPLETSPFIDRLAKEGTVFKNVVTPLPLTDGSHATILTSLHPLAHQVIRNATSLKDRVETIAEILKKNGYYTIGTIAAYHLSRKYNFSQGFDSFSDTWDKNSKYNDHWYRVGDSVNESLFGQIDEYMAKCAQQNEEDKPLFIWVHYYDPHSPYVDWKEIVFDSLEKNKANKKKFRYLKYDKEIRYTDNHIGALYGRLEEKGLTGSMVVCITADHGEQLGEHGGTAVHHDFYTETAVVPLIFSGYGIPGGKVVEDYVSTMDITATLLGRVKWDGENPGFKMHGINLLDAGGAPKTLPKRDFLVIGDPRFVRSIQWFSYPIGYIQNFDFMYKQWFVARGPAIPPGRAGAWLEDRLIPVSEGGWREEFFEKSDKYVADINYPNDLRTGLYFGLLRFNVEKDKGFSVGYRIGPADTSTTYSFADSKPGLTGRPVTVTAFFPVTPLDRLKATIQRKKGTVISGLRIALLPRDEALKYIMEAPGKIDVDNRIFKTLKTLRKFKTGDELYNLETDFAMVHNLLEDGGGDSSRAAYTEKVVKGKKAITMFLKFYGMESGRILGNKDREKEKPLSEEEKAMLKSLGYL